jgi:N-acetylmuramoyl-L-alanine amidase
MAREYGERVLYADTGTGASGHYYIDRDGRIFEFVEPGRTANHTRGFNPRSIGIELVNLGRYPDWYDSRRQAMVEPYSGAQIDALIALLRALRAQYPGLRHIAGHEALDRGDIAATDDPTLTVRRKRDPGELFPWARVLAAVPLTAPPEAASD